MDDVKLLHDVYRPLPKTKEEEEAQEGEPKFDRIELDIFKSIKWYNLQDTGVVYYVFRNKKGEFEDVSIVDCSKNEGTTKSESKS